MHCSRHVGVLAIVLGFAAISSAACVDSDVDAPHGDENRTSSGTGGSAPVGGSGGKSAGGTASNLPSGGAGASATGGGTSTGGSGGNGGVQVGGAAGEQQSAGTAGELGFGGAIEQCPGPSIDRLKEWGPTEVGGGMVADPAHGSLLVQEGDHYIARATFTGSGWGVFQVLLFNTWGVAANLTNSAGMRITYSATAEFFIQMRAKSSWSGGHHYRAAFPSTSGSKMVVFKSFENANWSQPPGADPQLDFAQVLKEVQGFTIDTSEPNAFVFYGFRVDGHVPPCD